MRPRFKIGKAFLDGKDAGLIYAFLVWDGHQRIQVERAFGVVVEGLDVVAQEMSTLTSGMRNECFRA